jgi:thiol-disulfide isomerase/thioredoxin
MTRLARLFALFLFAITSHALGQDLQDLNAAVVLDTKSREIKPAFQPGKAILILVLGTDCPITQKYAPTVKSLMDLYAEDINFIGIFPNQFSAKEVADFTGEYGISFPCYIDVHMTVVHLLGAKVTPEAFLISPDFKQLYSGAIDNWFYKLGNYRKNITEKYLTDAIQAYVAKKPVKITKTTAIGCPLPQQQTGGSIHKGHDHH